MNTNNIFIGSVYQIVNIKETSYGYYLPNKIEFETKKIKENALLYKKGSDKFIDLQNKLEYKANLNNTRQKGDVLVFTNDLEVFNVFLEKEERCTDMSEYIVQKRYQKIKNDFKNQQE